MLIPAITSWSVNAEKVRVTGNKAKDKIYHHHTGLSGWIEVHQF